jgi:hypothetical protein
MSLWKSPPALRLTPFYERDENAAYSFSVEASSNGFSGYTEASLVPDDLRMIGGLLSEFPAAGRDSQVTWELPGWLLSDASRLRFYLRDGFGHAAVHATLVYGAPNELQSATVIAPIQVAAVNELGTGLLAWAAGKRLEEEFTLRAAR